MARSGDCVDKAAILRRRAALVASALSGLAVSRAALAQPAQPVPEDPGIEGDPSEGVEVQEGEGELGEDLPEGDGLESLCEIDPSACRTIDVSPVAPSDGTARRTIPFATAQVCLSYAAPRTRLEVGVIPPLLAITAKEPVEAFALGGIRVGMEHRPTGRLWIEGEVASTFMANDVTRLVFLGGSFDGRYEWTRTFSVGLGVGAGYIFDVSHAENEGEYQSVVCGPVLVPLHLAYRTFQVELRAPFWVPVTGDLRPVLVAPYVALSYAPAIWIR